MLTGKIALVTGGSRGIGRAIALRLASEGADVIVNYRRKETAARAVVAEIEARGHRAKLVHADVGNSEDVRRMFEEVRQFGGLDILIANAATGVLGPLMNATEKHWHWTLDTNAWGLLGPAQLAAPIMQERGGGRIVALTSVGSRRVFDGYGLVGISKAAVESAVCYLAVELAPKNIIVNAVSPGFVKTDAVNYLSHTDELLEMARRQTPVGRLATVDDVADAVSFLCSDRAQMIVGQVITVDGGFSLPIARLEGSSFAP